MAPIFKSLMVFGALLATTVTAAPIQETKRAASSCTKDAPCKGQVTYYDTATSPSAPSSCGMTNDGETESVLALPHGLMTDADCGKTVTIHYGPITKTGKWWTSAWAVTRRRLTCPAICSPGWQSCSRGGCLGWIGIWSKHLSFP